MANLDKFLCTAYLSCCVVKQSLCFSVCFDNAEQIARLGEIILIVISEIVGIGISAEFQRRFFGIGLLLPFSVTVRLIMQGRTIIAVHPHRSVSMKSMIRT